MTLEPPPQHRARDKLAEIARAGIGETPGGGLLVELYRQWIGTAYERRWAAWMEKVHQLLVDLDARGIDIDHLIDTRPDFVTAVHDASRIAIGEHLEEKLDMLTAVLVNAATHEPDELADLWTLRYLAWIDELEPIHIRFLAFGVDPRRWLEEHNIATQDYMTGAQRVVFDLAKWPYGSEVIELALEDLRRLSLGAPGPGMVTGRSMYAPWISDRGRRFLDWLTLV